MTFRVGQKVVCVDGFPPQHGAYPTGIEPKEGAIYTIAALCPYRDRIHVDLVELPKYCRAFCDWRATRFRPLIERSTDTGMAILKKIASDLTTKITEKV